MKLLLNFLSLTAIWLLLTWSLQPQQLLVGSVLALLFTALLHPIYRGDMPHLLHPLRWFWFLVYILYFLYYCLHANLDVAYRALHPDVPIHPGIVKVRTRLHSNIAKTFLANSITLTPGTLTLDIIGDHLFVHWINVVNNDPEQQTEIVVKRFEKLLRRVFE